VTRFRNRKAPRFALMALAESQTKVDTSTRIFSMSSFIGLKADGYEPIGMVSGSEAVHLSTLDYKSASWRPNGQWATTAGDPSQTSVDGGEFPLAGYARALEHGWQLALSRLLQSVVELGGCGAIDVKVSEDRRIAGVRGLSLVGLAVRGPNRASAPPFATALSGMDLAKLHRLGWMPIALVVATAISMRRNDALSGMMIHQSVMPGEIPSHTHLLIGARNAARDLADDRTLQLGAVGLLISGPIETRVEELHSRGTDYEDFMAEARVIGTAIRQTTATDLPIGEPSFGVDLGRQKKNQT